MTVSLARTKLLVKQTTAAAEMTEVGLRCWLDKRLLQSRGLS